MVSCLLAAVPVSGRYQHQQQHGDSPIQASLTTLLGVTFPRLWPPMALPNTQCLGGLFSSSHPQALALSNTLEPRGLCWVAWCLEKERRRRDCVTAVLMRTFTTTTIGTTRIMTLSIAVRP